MEQPDKRQREDIDNGGEKSGEKGNKFLKILRDNRKETLKVVNDLKEKLFIPLTDDQIIDDVGRLVRTIEKNSSKMTSTYFGFKLDRQYGGDVILYKLLIDIRSTLNNNQDYKRESREFEQIFNQFKDAEITKLAVALSEEIDFPFYEYTPSFKLRLVKSRTFDPPYGVSYGNKGLDAGIQVWWGMDPE